MSKDFSAKQIRVSQLIASGGIAGTKAGLIIYSGSAASGYEGAFKDANLLKDVGTDVYVFVSGAIDSKVARGDAGNGITGTTLFGGDVVFSGTLYADRMVVEVDVATTGSVLVSGSLFVSRSAVISQGLTVNDQKGSTPNNDVVFRGSTSTSLFHVDASLDRVVIQGTAGDDTELFKVIGNDDGGSGNNADFLTITPASVVINEDSNDVNFRVESQNKSHAVFVDAGSNKVLILSGGAGASVNEGAGGDVNFYVSGSIQGKGSKPADAKGISLFGGDAFISGTLIVSGGNPLGGGTISGSIHLTDTGISYLQAGDAITISSSSNGQIIVTSTGPIDGSGAGDRVAIWSDADTLTSNALFTFNASGLSVSAAAVFNEGHDANADFRVESDTKTSALLIDAGTEQIALLTGGTTAANAYTSAKPIPNDVGIFISGSLGGIGKTGGGAAKGTVLIGGDTFVSGTLVVSGAVNGAALGSYGTISGSIFETAKGISYLRAGANVGIVSASDGQITISTTSPDGSGATNRVAYWSDSDTLTSRFRSYI